LKNVGYNGLYYVGFSGSYDFPSLEVLGSYAMAFSRMTEFNAPNLKFANNFCLGGTTNMNILVSASLGTSTTLEKMNGSVFSNQVNLAYVDISTLSTSSINNLGGSPANNSVFNNVASGGTIYVPSFFETNNSGQPDGDIVYLRDTKGWTINYV